MASRDNVYLVKGNHEAMASYVLHKLNVEITEDNADSHIDAELMQMIIEWQKDHSQTGTPLDNAENSYLHHDNAEAQSDGKVQTSCCNVISAFSYDPSLNGLTVKE